MGRPSDRILTLNDAISTETRQSVNCGNRELVDPNVAELSDVGPGKFNFYSAFGRHKNPSATTGAEGPLSIRFYFFALDYWLMAARK